MCVEPLIENGEQVECEVIPIWFGTALFECDSSNTSNKETKNGFHSCNSSRAD